MKNTANSLWQRFIAEYPVNKLWKLLITVSMPLAYVFIFVGNAVSYYPHWAYSIHDYTYGNPFLIGFPLAIIAIVAIWKNRPFVSLAATVLYMIPIIYVMIYNASEPANLTAVYYLELIFSLTGVVSSLIASGKRENSRPGLVNDRDISYADEIMKYKKLLDDGIITPAEYEAKKKELLKY